MAESPPEIHFEIEKLERKHAEHPEGRFFVPLANAYRKLGDLETSEALLREGLRRHPDYLSAHIVLGRTLADRGATREAVEEFRYVLSLDPQNLIALRTLGELAVGEGRSDEATRWYEELLAVDPMNEEARQALESLRSEPAPTAFEEEFRAGSGWWEAPPEVEEPQSAESPPELQFAPGPQFSPEPERGEIPEEELPFLSLDPSEPTALRDEGESFAPVGYGLDDDDPFAGFIDLDAPVQSTYEEPTDELAAEEEAQAEEVEVVTETIAELYARQGFHERAAGVYRELIRRRGGDPALESRLAELERLAESSVEEVPAPAPPSEASVALETLEAGPADIAAGETDAIGLDADYAEAGGPDADYAEADEAGTGEADEGEPAVAEPVSQADDPFAGSFADGFAGPGEDASEDPPLEAPWDPSAEPDEEIAVTFPARAAGPTVEQFLAGLLAWRPEETAPAGAGAEEAVLTAAAEPEPVRPADDGTTDAGTGRAEEEPFPWEVAGGPVEEPAAAERPGAALPREELLSYEDVLADAPRNEDAGPAISPPVERAAPAPPPPAPPAKSEEDEDLESFQAWLRSLKR